MRAIAVPAASRPLFYPTDVAPVLLEICIAIILVGLLLGALFALVGFAGVLGFQFRQTPKLRAMVAGFGAALLVFGGGILFHRVADAVLPAPAAAHNPAKASPTKHQHSKDFTKPKSKTTPAADKPKGVDQMVSCGGASSLTGAVLVLHALGVIRRRRPGDPS